MAFHLITDFGLEGPYVGQVLARLYHDAPQIPAFSLFADAPAFDPQHGAYLVAAYGGFTAVGDVMICVVDPGVGTERGGLILQADGRWYVGPDNGLLVIAEKQAQEAAWWWLAPPIAGGSQTFHGRDWFAPAAARIARGELQAVCALSGSPTVGADWPDDLAEIVYIDRYGNAMTGLRGTTLPMRARLSVAGVVVKSGTVFAAARPDTPFWYVNANGLVEIAVNRGRADEVLGLAIGSPVERV
ncbi:SAM hydrolase/SAM-dependent halogenase family protein [Acidihalobacter ferrooxydans]|uniref:SAM-dependent chlorinase/fluorinase n=1 Tax=Acidihalobacter ferrooxydans TaxID=1765967 RepID=A0A1P8UJQ2_9GAMM|nr:SAM-dependent chlorinase/fluorinase [Acidihalobacter ferrooxydans]APZ44059.1 hypothetical protein BW247_13950 [Acidihalobacter ferrooxydans]